MPTLSHKETYYKDEDASFEFEKLDGLIILHCEVYKWKISVLRKAYSVFGKFCNEALAGGVEKIATVTPNPKFAKLFGGTSVAVIEHENKIYEVIIWDLRQQPF